MTLQPRSFDSLIDFTRHSSATFVGSNGLIQSTPASRNLLTYTHEFGRGSWEQDFTSIAVSDETAPDGSKSASKLVAPVSTSQPRGVYPNVPLSAANHVFSFHAKADEYGLIRAADAASGEWFASFNLDTGTAVSGGTGGVRFVSAAIVPAGNGWYRCSVVFLATGGFNAPLTVGYPAGSEGPYGAFYAGDGVSGVHVWGAQLELGSRATEYTRNYGSRFPARFDHDPVTRAPRGLLLEEQRTNLLLNSESFAGPTWAPNNVSVSSNVIESPTGEMTGDAVTGTSSASNFKFIQQAWFAAGIVGTYTFSVYLKAGSAKNAIVRISDQTGAKGARVSVDLESGLTSGANSDGTAINPRASIEDAGRGWYRVSVTTTIVDVGSALLGYIWLDQFGDSTSTGTFYLWGAQLEAGSFATSYIPTGASQVTRAPDVALINPSNFSPWYNQSEGTFVVEALVRNVGADNLRLLGLNGSAATPAFVSNTQKFGVFDGSALLTDNDIPTQAAFKAATAYTATEKTAILNGGAVVSAARSAGFPLTPSTSLHIGSDRGNFAFTNGHIRSLRYYPTRLSNDQLQALTA